MCWICATMIFGGFETTARLLFWACYLLTLDRPEQERLRSEVTAFAPDRVMSLDDLANWPRLRMTLLETLRLYPPVPHIIREAVADDEIAGEPVQAGTQVWVSPWVLHRHRRFWDQPTAFLPERFAGKPLSWTANGAYLPFGSGPRTCIGATFAMAEAQIMLAKLLGRYRMILRGGSRPVLPVARVTTEPSFAPPFHFAAREVLVAIVHRFELATIDGNAGLGQEPQPAAQLHELGADLAYGWAIVLAKICDHLVIRHKTAQQPDHFQIAARLAFKPPARLHPVEIAVDVKLQMNGRVKGRPARLCRLHLEAKLRKIECINKRIDGPDGIVLTNPIVEAFRQ